MPDPHDVPSGPRLASQAFLGFALAMTALYCVAHNLPLGTVAAGVLTVGAVAAGLEGLRRYRPRHPALWVCFLGSSVLWALANVLRTALTINDGEILVIELVSLAGYCGCALGLLLAVRGGRSESDPHAVEAVLVGVAVAFVGWAIFTFARGGEHRTWVQAASQVIYPALDAVILCLAVRLSSIHGRSNRAATLLLCAGAVIFLGDVQWALSASRLLVLPVVGQFGCYLLGFGFWGAAALDPSMRRLGEPRVLPPVPVGPWRAMATGSTLLIPTVVAVIHPPTRLGERLVILGILVVVAALVSWRLLSAGREEEQFEQRLRFRTNHDLETGLPNRWWMVRALDEAIDGLDRTGDRVAVLQLGFDETTDLMDSWGVEAAAEVWVNLEGGVRAAVGRSSGPGRPLLALNGSGYAIAVRVADEGEAAHVARRLVREAAAPVRLSVGEVLVHPKLGITIGRGEGRPSARTLLREAETALRHATTAEPVAWFEPGMRQRASRRVELERDLRRALDSSELELAYQPIVSLATGEWTGVEALVRWRHPELGSIPPDEFIGVAESSGLIADLGLFVLTESLEQLATWRRCFRPDLSVSVNLSAHQLGGDALDGLVGRIENSGPGGNGLWLELTESTLITRENRLALEQVRKAGARLAVDDFGTGYSSLSYLQSHPVDRLKIDRSFVSGLDAQHGSAAIVRAVLAMARALEMDCVAEGVETDEQRRRLLELGCPRAQGYLFGRPMSAEQISRSLASADGVGAPTG